MTANKKQKLSLKKQMTCIRHSNLSLRKQLTNLKSQKTIRNSIDAGVCGGAEKSASAGMSGNTKDLLDDFYEEESEVDYHPFVSYMFLDVFFICGF